MVGMISAPIFQYISFFLFLCCPKYECQLFQKSKTKKMNKKSSTSSRTPGDVEGASGAKKARLVLKTIIYDESIANQWLDEPPLEVWDHHIIPLLSLRDLALSRTVCTFFEAYWQDKFSNNVLPLRVGNDVATIDDVMGVIEILSSRREYTKLNPCVVLLGKGDHQITSSWTDPIFGYDIQTTLGITRSNITFLGKGNGETTILGGFGIENFENITFKNMTVTNTSENGHGIHMRNATVELFDVALNKCKDTGLCIQYPTFETTLVATRCEFANSYRGARIMGSLTSTTFKNCVFKDNNEDGIYGSDEATIHLHGEATAIHSNGGVGICAYSSAKVLIHLPSHHNTSYNNRDHDRYTLQGATITNVED
jgi:hypothetical protein